MNQASLVEKIEDFLDDYEALVEFMGNFSPLFEILDDTLKDDDSIESHKAFKRLQRSIKKLNRYLDKDTTSVEIDNEAEKELNKAYSLISECEL